MFPRESWVISRSPEETVGYGEWLGRRLRKGDVVSLVGEVGGGKTTFTKGIAQGLGIRVDLSEVTSPTFVFIKEYPCRIPLHHVDLYRLEGAPQGPDAELIQECFAAGGVTVLEWGGKAEGILPAERYEVRFEHAGPSSRKIRWDRLGAGGKGE